MHTRGGGAPTRPRTNVATLDRPRRRQPRRRPPNRPASAGPPAAARRSFEDGNRFATVVADAEADLITRWQHLRRNRPKDATALTVLLIGANRSLVRGAVRRIRASRLDRCDLEQAAITGILVALDRFRPASGAPFGPYALHWIRKELQRALAAGDFPIAVAAHRTGMVAATAALAASSTDHELAVALGVGTSTAAGLRAALQVDNFDDQPERVRPATADPTEELVTRHAVQAALDRLEPTAAAMVRLRHGLDDGIPRSLREVAHHLGVSDFTVRTHLQRAHTILARLLR